jgi:uncharacterized damage-inducible protein DinB
MDLIAHYLMLAIYNRVANERVYSCCAQLGDADYRLSRKGSFGSIHALLNHLLLGDRIWMARFAGAGGFTPPLNTVLFENFESLRAARADEDARIASLFEYIDPSFFGRMIEYVNNQGSSVAEQASVAVAHFFNHQTHHRGQVHVMLSQTAVAAPALDLHRIVNPI